MIEVITNAVVLLACIMCIITLIHQLKPKFKRKPKRLFYVKYNDGYMRQLYRNEWFAGDIVYVKNKALAGKFTDNHYDSIKYLLPDDHTLELVNHD